MWQKLGLSPSGDNCGLHLAPDYRLQTTSKQNQSLFQSHPEIQLYKFQNGLRKLRLPLYPLHNYHSSRHAH